MTLASIEGISETYISVELQSVIAKLAEYTVSQQSIAYRIRIHGETVSMKRLCSSYSNLFASRNIE